MANKTIIFIVIAVLVVGLVFLGFEVKKLRSEVVALSSYSPMTQRTSQPNNNHPTFNKHNNFYSDLAYMQRQMDRLFDQSFNSWPWRDAASVNNLYAVATDIKDNKKEYIITMDIPGMKKDQINVEVKNNTIFISGERNKENEDKGKGYYRQERSFGYFSENIPLPKDADSKNISVTYKRGVLKIEIAKLKKASSEQEGSTKIKVN